MEQLQNQLQVFNALGYNCCIVHGPNMEKSNQNEMDTIGCNRVLNNII